MDYRKNEDGQKILIAYASQFGTTAEVAEVIGETLSQQGCMAETKWIKDVQGLENYDAVIIGSAIQYDKWMPEASAFVIANRTTLENIPVAYFFTCLTLAKQNEKTEKKALAYADKLAAIAPHVEPINIGRFAGAVNYNKLSFFVRQMFKGLSLITGVKEGDYRDWEAIRSWAEDLHLKLANEQMKALIPG